MIGLCTLSIGDGRTSKKALQLSIGLMTTHSDWLEAPTNKGCFRAFYHHFRHMLGITQR